MKKTLKQKNYFLINIILILIIIVAMKITYNQFIIVLKNSITTQDKMEQSPIYVFDKRIEFSKNKHIYLVHINNKQMEKFTNPYTCKMPFIIPLDHYGGIFYQNGRKNAFYQFSVDSKHKDIKYPDEKDNVYYNGEQYGIFVQFDKPINSRCAY